MMRTPSSSRPSPPAEPVATVTAVAPPAGAGRRRPNPATGTGPLLRRNLVLYLRSPASIAGALVFPCVFFLGFFGVLSEVMDAQGIDYAQYLPPAVVVQALFFTAMSSAFYLADERTSGMLARLKALPIGRLAPVGARVGADGCRAVASIVVLLVLGTLVGFRFEAGVAAAIGFVALALLFELAVSAGCAVVGLRVSSAAAAASLLTLPYLPLLMLSSAFVPVRAFPGWLQPVVEHSPVTATVDALRALAEGGPTAEPLRDALLWLGALLAVFGVLAAHAFRDAR